MLCKVELKTQNGGLLVGDNLPVRVNCNVGANSAEQMAYEKTRLAAIKDSGVFPDCFMDLSVGKYPEPLYIDIIREFGCPVGIVPAYLFPSIHEIAKKSALDLLKRLADDGLSFFTIHLTASLEIYKIAKANRKIAVTSRGGSIVLRHMMESGLENIWLSLLPEIISLAKSYGIVISLGSTFRPSGISEACDEAHIKETEAQLRLCKLLQGEGVQVMLENVGHIALDRLEEHCKLLRQFNAPIMPLGPTPTDCAENEDHVAAAIGASMMGYWNCAHIINCINRSEHTKPFFSIEETLEAIRTAKLAAHIVDVTHGINVNMDEAMLTKRSSTGSCMVYTSNECTRCAQYCPLKIGEDYGS